MGGQACLGWIPTPGWSWNGAGGAGAPEAEEPQAVCSAAPREFHPTVMPWDSRPGEVSAAFQVFLAGALFSPASPAAGLAWQQNHPKSAFNSREIPSTAHRDEHLIKITAQSHPPPDSEFYTLPFVPN